jgi:hypothetical protein
MPKLSSTATTAMPNLNDANRPVMPNSSDAQQQQQQQQQPPERRTE